MANVRWRTNNKYFKKLANTMWDNKGKIKNDLGTLLQMALKRMKN